MNDFILGFAGSLRKGSYNRALLRKAIEINPTPYPIISFELNAIPLYDDDMAKDNTSQAINEFREKIKDSRGILIASPEYNYSITGVLKNAIDWASTVVLGNVLESKPVAIMGASTSRFGTARSQLALRGVLHAARAQVLQKPELMITRAANAFDEDGDLINEKAVSVLSSLLTAFIDILD